MFQWVTDKLLHPIPIPIPNLIPEPAKLIIGSHYFWLALWLTVTSVIGNKILSKNFGGYVGIAAGGTVWYILISKAIIDLLLIVVMFSLPIFGSLLNRSGLFRRIKGVKICPDCAEEVKSSANVCKHCAHHF